MFALFTLKSLRIDGKRSPESPCAFLGVSLGECLAHNNVRTLALTPAQQQQSKADSYAKMFEKANIFCISQQGRSDSFSQNFRFASKPSLTMKFSTFNYRLPRRSQSRRDSAGVWGPSIGCTSNCPHLQRVSCYTSFSQFLFKYGASPASPVF